jgi:hypothetical protein
MNSTQAIRDAVEYAAVAGPRGHHHSITDDEGHEYFAVRCDTQAGDLECTETGEHFLVTVDRRTAGLAPVSETDVVDAGYLLCSEFLRREHPLGRVVRRLP